MSEAKQTSGACFSRFQDSFTDFLRDSSRKLENASFPARNFLLDEGVSKNRMDSYTPFVKGVTHRDPWEASHRDYLYERVRLEKPGFGYPKQLKTEDPSRCPETFRNPEVLRQFGQCLDSLYLLRLEPLAPILGNASVKNVGEFIEAAREIVLAGEEEREVATEALDLVRAVLRVWNEACDLRPAFVAFQAEHEDLFGKTTAEDAPHWANTLRDRLGLYHVRGSDKSEPILVFRYRVGDVPKVEGIGERHAIAVPTVLDGALSEAFYPAPAAEPSGRVLDLSAAGREPASEVLHPYRHLEAQEIFRVGEVTEGVPEDLAQARKTHLLWLREGYPGYASDIDADLLEGS